MKMYDASQKAKRTDHSLRFNNNTVMGIVTVPNVSSIRGYQLAYIGFDIIAVRMWHLIQKNIKHNII